MMKKLLLIISLFFALALPTQAQTEYTTSTQVPDFSVGTLDPILRSMGYQTQLVNFGDGSKGIAAQYSGGAILFRPRVDCANGCKGLNMVGLIRGNQDLYTLNKFNEAQDVSTIVFLSPGNLYMRRYLIADYGTNYGSLAANIGNFQSTINGWFQFSKGEVSAQLNDNIVQTVSQQVASGKYVKPQMPTPEQKMLSVFNYENSPELFNQPHEQEAAKSKH